MNTIKIKGLNCNHCVAAVTEAISEIPGVTKVEVKLKKLLQKESIATWEGNADESAIIAAIIEAGYEPVAQVR